MPRYDYRCRPCGSNFELTRPMDESSAPAICPSGHSDTVKVLSAVAVTGVRGGSRPAAAEPSGGGGCCGGGCCG